MWIGVFKKPMENLSGKLKIKEKNRKIHNLSWKVKSVNQEMIYLDKMLAKQHKI
jgi:hypothetical protein